MNNPNEKPPRAAPLEILAQPQSLAAPAPHRPKIPWYRQAFQEDYLDVYQHRDLAEAELAVEFLTRVLALTPTHRLLDLCCGPGRHLVYLAGRVGEAIGLDLSRALLRRARTHARAAHIATSAPLLQADMRRLPLASGSLDRVVNLFTSFGYFENEDDNLTVLREIARVLKTDGRLALDHINRAAMLENLKPHTERPLPGKRRLIEKRHWDPQTLRVGKEVTSIEPDGQVKGWRESVRVYEPEELEQFMRQAGLDPLARYGDYDGRPWNEHAPRLIVIARRVSPACRAGHS